MKTEKPYSNPNFPKVTPEMVESVRRDRIKSQGKSPVPLSEQILNVTSDLTPFSPSADAPWDKKRAGHLARRMNVASSPALVESYLNSSAPALVDAALDVAQNADLPAAPPWENKTPPPRGSSDEERLQYARENFELVLEYQYSLVELMKTHPLREKMVLLWHNHFVTEQAKYQLAPFAYRHFTSLRKNALGNFKTLTKEIGLDHAMLIYLDGIENTKESPNENYARELLELFTMGIGNYTETDIREISRALTGWTINIFTFAKVFVPERYDEGAKTVFGRTGNFDYDAVIDLIFEEKSQEIAQFVCAKIYRHFVFQEPNETVVNQMAHIFLDNDFEIAPVVSALLKSEHFFDDAFIGAMIKPPIDLLLSIYAENKLVPTGRLLEAQSYLFVIMDQFLFNPPNVAGWGGQREWISTTTFPNRWDVILYTLYFDNQEYRFDHNALLDHVSDKYDPHKVALELAEMLIPVPLIDEEKNRLSGVLLGGLPDYEWSPAAEGARGRVMGLVEHLRKLPEYQLM